MVEPELFCLDTAVTRSGRQRAWCVLDKAFLQVSVVQWLLLFLLQARCCSSCLGRPCSLAGASQPLEA